MFRLLTFIIFFTTPFFGWFSSLNAQDIRISKEMLVFDIEINGKPLTISRNQNPKAVIPEERLLRTISCPPFCIQSTPVAQGVKTVGEIEVLAFLKDEVARGSGFLIDARDEVLFHNSTIPASINLPFNLFENPEENPFLAAILAQLGGKQAADGSWKFSGSPKLMLFCNDLQCGQSPRAVKNLLEIGYPAEKLFYYRGGMRDWVMLGLTTVQP